MRRSKDGQSDPVKAPAAVRQAMLARTVVRDGFLSVARIAPEFGVSGMTIRRDLEALEQKGVLQRTHGGAVARRQRQGETYEAEEPLFRQREQRHAAAKARIAAAAAALMAPGETIALDVGTTVLALARELAGRADLNIFTNSLPCAIVLAAGRSSVQLLGGRLRGPELAVVGPMAVAQVGQYHFDRVFIGVAGVTSEGFFDYALEDTEVKRALIAHADEVVVLCDASKFQRRSLAKVCDLRDCRILVTDARPRGRLASRLRTAHVDLLIA